MKKTNIILLIITLHSFAVLYSQQKISINETGDMNLLLTKHEKENDSLNKLNFLDMDYKNLDKNFKIIINSSKFNSINVDNRITTNYKDSLMVVLKHELKNDNAAGKAFHRILYKWEKLGYYLWKTDDEVKAIGIKFGFGHPYRFYEYLMNDKINSKEKLALLNEVKLKIKRETNKNLNIIPYKTFLNEAFKLNPDRLKAMDIYIKKNSEHKH